MEIYSIDQLKRILHSSTKPLVIEIMDMDNEAQNELHNIINHYVLEKIESKIGLLKINKNFYHNIVEVVDQFPTFVLYHNQKVLAQSSEIQNLESFQDFIQSIL